MHNTTLAIVVFGIFLGIMCLPDKGEEIGGMKGEVSKSSGAAWVRVDYKGWTNAYRFQTTGMVITVVGDVGARIMEYGPAGKNIFWQDPAFFGATLRQKGVYFHPGGSQFDVLDEKGNGVCAKDPELWIGEYKMEVKVPARLTAVSPVGTNTALQMTRDIEVEPLTGDINVKQTVYNRSNKKIKISIWDRTWTAGPCLLAVPVETGPDFPEGWCFLLEKGGVCSGEPASARPSVAGQFQYEDGTLVIDPAGKSCQIIMKSARGWFAYAQEDILYLKNYAIGNGQYPLVDCPASVWLSEQGWKKVGLMAEMEPMSPIYGLAPGESCCFQEKWQLIKLKSPVRNREQLRNALKFHSP